ncbi:S41 family peptidase [Ilyomonas limi]|uniref:S41 family peptidase n=1 Tax=Ilyomonas limi TaxID=2575867 RepID=A0A4U3KUQ6_9BACT|nr:S41 family peptidase [Ilyomonas limi]TKK66120.1 S41 family peptidase [Ilyomonas limi]
MGSKKFQVWLPLLFAIVMTVGMVIGYQMRAKTAVANSFFQNNISSSVLPEILSLIKNKYVDKVGTDSLKADAINEMLAHLDPHSVYIPPSELQNVNEDLQGNFQGIGIEFQIFDDTVNVVNVIAGGPSDEAGMEIGDKMLAVYDTISIAGVNIKPDKIRNLLRGEGGTDVNVTVLRNGQQKKLTIERGTIPVPSVDVSYVIAPQTGFIRINKFAETTYEEFLDALKKLQQQHIQKLILDLRGNGGGFLNEAVSIADEFLDDNKLIVYTQGTNVPKTEYRCKREGLFEKGELVVLVDETSASASEILAGALQDWDRATIIGRRTFGKGLVQQQYNLTDGGALRLTVARYYTPLGRNIQKPYNKGKEAYEEELIQRFHNGEVVIGDTTKPTTQAFKTPGGHLVYGGGGITPDIFIPFDTTAQPQPVVDLFYKGTLSNFVYHYYMDHKSTLQSIKTPQQLTNQYRPDNNDWQQLVNFAQHDRINLSNVSETVKQDVLKKLSAYLARQMFRTEGYFVVTNPKDPMVEKALAVLQ